MKQRLLWLDMVKGFTIVLVVLGHVMNSQNLFSHPVNVWLHYFHMPIFFLLSGFLAIHTLKRSFIVNFQKKIISLMFPFLSCGLLYSLTLEDINTFVTDLHHAGYWFLLSLFSCWIIFLVVAKLMAIFCPPPVRNFYIVEMIFFLLPFFLGNILMKFLSEEMLNITSFPLTFSYYRFFILGYFMGRIYEDKKITEKLKQAEIQTIISAFSIFLFILFSILIFSQSPVLSFMPITLIQLVLCISFFFVIYKSDSFVYPFISKLSGYLGNNSLGIYVFHVFFVYEFGFEYFVNLLPASFQFLFAMALTIVVLIATLTIAIPFKNNKFLSLIFLGQKK